MANFAYFQASGKQTANTMFLYTSLLKVFNLRKKLKLPLCVKNYSTLLPKICSIFLIFRKIFLQKNAPTYCRKAEFRSRSLVSAIN